MNKLFKKNIKIELVAIGILVLAVLAVITYNFKPTEAQQSSAPISSSPLLIQGNSYPIYSVDNSFTAFPNAAIFYKLGSDGVSLSSMTPPSSGSFVAQDVGVYIAKTPLGDYAFAVIQPPSQQQSSESTTTYCYYQGSNLKEYIGLNVDKTFLAAGTGNVTSTISFVNNNFSVPNGHCVVYSPTDSNVNNHLYSISSMPTVISQTISTNSYSFDCFDQNNNSVCQPPQGLNIPNKSTNKIPVYVHVFGGSAGGIQEIAPSSQ